MAIPVELNKLVQKLDKRAKKSDKKLGSFVRKNRVQSGDSTIPPPSDAPRWAISKTTTSSPTEESPINHPAEDSVSAASALAGATPTSSGLGVLRRRLRTTSKVLEDINDSSSSTSSSSEDEVGLSKTCIIVV